MAPRTLLLVFVLPAAASLAFGGSVFYGITSEYGGLDAQSGHLPSGTAVAKPAPSEPAAGSASLVITGLNSEYAASDPIRFEIEADRGTGCTYLYVDLIPASGSKSQEIIPDACLGQEAVPVEFPASAPGKYDISAFIITEGIKLVAEAGFTVK